MAKKNANVQIEGVELKPQVIGYSYKKKGNLGRIIFLLAVFLIVIYYINDISYIVNKWLGKSSASTIEQMAKENEKKRNDRSNIEDKTVYYEIKDDLNIVIYDLILNNFNFSDGVLTFDVNNNTNNDIDLSDKNLYIKLFDENKNSLNSYKLEINNIGASNKNSLRYDANNKVKYFAIDENNDSSLDANMSDDTN